MPTDHPDSDVEAAVLEFFARHGQQPLPGAAREARLACAYLDEGVIDSMGIVLMVTEFEERFGIRFSAEDMQSYEFQTPGGLVALIRRRLAEAR